MEITLFGIIWILFIIICFAQRGVKWMTFALLFSMIFQSNNVFVISGLGIGPQIFTTIVFIIKTYFVKPYIFLKNGFESKLSKFNWVFIILLLIILVSIFFNDGNISLLKFSYVSLLGFYMLCFIRLKHFDYTEHKIFIDKTIRFIVLFVVFVGFLQVLTKLGILPITDILRIFIYNDVTSNSVIFNTKPTSRLYSTFMEPSYAGAFLVASFFYFALKKDYKIQNYLILFLIFISILLTESSTAYATFMILTIIWILTGTNRRVMISVLSVFAVLSLIIFTVFNDIIQTVFFDKLESSSGIVRGRWNEWAIDAFQSSPIIGVGYKNQRASSLLFTILGELGLLGVITYIWMLLKLVISLFYIKRVHLYYIGSLLGVIAVVVSQIIGNPDLDFSVLWMAMYILAITKNRNQETIMNRRIKL